MGNSEVGHLNLGAGRVVMQDLVRIGTAIETGSFHTNPAFVAACGTCDSRRTLHLLGLLGNGGVHAHESHLYALVDLAVQRAGAAHRAARDARRARYAAASGLALPRETLARIEGKAQLASVSGRYYGMDRDNRWERTGLVPTPPCAARAQVEPDALAALQRAYDAGVHRRIRDAVGDAPAPTVRRSRPCATATR
jgi:2,3-bisphosphoglycerate-independent phosphoglycerate mutase